MESRKKFKNQGKYTKKKQKQDLILNAKKMKIDNENGSV